MVNLKVRKAQVGQINMEIDCELEAPMMEVFATMIELEHTVFTFLDQMEQKTGLDIHEAFLENIAERFNKE